MCFSHVPATTDTTTRPAGRARLWDLPSGLHCSVIGTCVPTAELRRLFQKAEGRPPGGIGDYDLHRLFVQAAAGGFRLSRLTQRYLEQTYRASVERFSRVRGAERLLGLWQEVLDTGGVAGAYWALLTHRDTTEQLRDLAAGEIHMLSHEAGRVWQGERLRRQRLEADHWALRQRLNERHQECQRLHGELERLQRQVRQLETELHRRDDTPARPQSGNDNRRRLKNAALRNRIQVLEARLTANDCHEHCRAEQLEALRAENEALRRQLADDSGAEPVATPPCADLNLCGRCILYVGGLHSARDQYRRLVEGCNGRFLHHDGGREDGHQRLRALLQQADTVFCPLGCVSHQAMGEIKALCKRDTKPVKLLSGHSLSAFTAALETLQME